MVSDAKIMFSLCSDIFLLSHFLFVFYLFYFIFLSYKSIFLPARKKISQEKRFLQQEKNCYYIKLTFPWYQETLLYLQVGNSRYPLSLLHRFA